MRANGYERIKRVYPFFNVIKSNTYHKSANKTDKRIRADTDTVSVLKSILINNLTKNGYGKRICFWQM
jgi:ferredoxin-thioredoxin reductase catalytic subunit